ncbi:MAG TPA: hypothetical protein VFA83_04245 [Acidimicrobiales bacterium]|nr:hypothetical protein [Acidimicrobiales bacterium]
MTNVVRRAARGACFALGVFMMAAGVAPAAHAASPLTPGDLVVYRVGTGSAALTSASTAVFLDDFATTGTGQVPKGSLPLPTASAGANAAVTSSGTATSEGELALSADGSSVIATGYGVAPGTASIANTASPTTSRVVAIANVGTGTVDSSTALSAYSGNNIRSAVTDGANAWTSGTGSATPNGISYGTIDPASPPEIPTTVSGTVTNTRQVQVINGTVWFSTGAGTRGIYTFGSEPTSATAPTNVIPTGSTSSPYGFVMARLGSGPTSNGFDTAYVADDTASTGGIQKWTFNGTAWSLTGTVTAATGARGLVGLVTSGGVQLYSTTGGNGAAGGGSLWSYLDAAGFGASPSGSLVTLATAPTNEAFRGVVLLPNGSGPALPEAPLAVLMPVAAGAGFIVLSVARRRRRRPATV